MSTPPPQLKIVTHTQPVRRRDSLPIASLSIMVICVVVFVAMWVQGKGDVTNVASAFGDKENTRIQAGEWWRLITAMFLHGSVIHIVVNGLSLYWLGWSLERIYGSRKFLMIYLFAGVVSFAVSYMRSPVPSLGASGAIFGLVGAGLVFPVRFRSLIPDEVRSKILSQLLTTAVINLAIGFQIPQVDNWAHIGGMAGGGFLALFFIPDVLDKRPQESKREFGLWSGVGVSIAILLFAGFAQWRAPKEPPLPKMHFFAPPGEAPWWTIGIPVTWLQTDKGWRTPSGALLDVSDSIQYPLRRKELERWLGRAGNKVAHLKVSDYPARRITLSTEASLFDICVIDVKGEAVLLVLKYDQKSYTLAQGEMPQALQNIKILHDPPAPRTP